MSESSCYIASCQICPYPFLALCLCVLSFSAAQRNQLCVCLRYLVNLLRENRLPAAAPSHHSHLLCLTIVIAERSARLLDIRTHGLRREVVFSRGSFVRVGVLEGRFRPISLSSPALCVLTLPASVSWSTCSRRAGCQQGNSHITSALSEPPW